MVDPKNLPQLAGKNRGQQMFNIKLMLVLFITGVVGDMILKKSDRIGYFLRSLLSNQRGEVEVGVGDIPKDLQPAVDKIVQERLGRERAKFGDYEDLKKFKTEFEKNQDAQKLADLEKAKEYDTAKKGLETKVNEFSQKLSAKDMEIQDLKISHNLSNEISRQGGYTEETIAMIKSQAVLDANGNVVIKAKDANGADIQVSVADGIKKFLAERPYLVKGTHKAGSGSGGDGGAGSGAGAGGGGEDTLDSLNAQLVQANKGTDLKLRSEIKGKINALLIKKGVSRN